MSGLIETAQRSLIASLDPWLPALMATGLELAHPVVAAFAGDLAMVGRVEFDLPETGACGVGLAGPGEVSGSARAPPVAAAKRCCA